MLALERELAFARELAARCGDLALRQRRGGPEALDAHEKPAGEGLVTRADTELNRVIVEAIAAAFPGDTVVAEEAAGPDPRRGDEDRCWYIDPIDGTVEYARGELSWAIHIGLCVGGRPTLGVVHEPARDRMSWGVLDPAGSVALCRVGQAPPRPLAPSRRGRDALRLASSKNHSSRRTHEVLRILDIEPADNLRMGSTGVKMTAVARAEVEVYINPRGRTKLWDSCAPEAVLVAAGGVVTDLHGRPLDYRGALANARGILASDGHDHSALVERLRPLTATWFPG